MCLDVSKYPDFDSTITYHSPPFPSQITRYRSEENLSGTFIQRSCGNHSNLTYRSEIVVVSTENHYSTLLQSLGLRPADSLPKSFRGELDFCRSACRGGSVPSYVIFPMLACLRGPEDRENQHDCYRRLTRVPKIRGSHELLRGDLQWPDGTFTKKLILRAQIRSLVLPWLWSWIALIGDQVFRQGAVRNGLKDLFAGGYLG